MLIFDETVVLEMSCGGRFFMFQKLSGFRSCILPSV